jgi:SNF2 family DNA or RNA helicase
MVFITREFINNNYIVVFNKEIKLLKYDNEDINLDDLIYINYDYYSNVIIDKNNFLDKILYKEDSIFKFVNLYPYLSDNNFLPQLEIYRNPHSFPNFIGMLNNVNNNLYISYYIYKHSFDLILLNNHRNLYNIKINFSKLLDYKENYMNHLLSYQFILDILKPKVIENKLNNINSSLKLYDYQIKDINRMIELENGTNIQILKNKKHVYNFYNYLFDVNGSLIVDGLNDNSIIYNYMIKGGFLINEMGLGKTIECLELLNQTTDTNQFIKHSSNNCCNYFYKRGKNKNTYCNKILKDEKSKYFCKSHESTPFIERLQYNINNNLIIENFTFQSLYNYKSKATLIVCPTQLCDQWIREYYSKFDNNKIIYMITNKESFESITLAELLYADIIIVSYNLFTNNYYKNNTFNIYTKYIDSLNSEWNNIYPEIFSTTSIYFNDFCKNILYNENHKLFLFKQKNIPLKFIFWDRIILDEFHEVSINVSNDIFQLMGDKKWIVTGTPFPNGFINLKMYFNFFGIYINNLHEITNISKLFIRNTKESVQSEIKKIDIMSTVHKLNLNVVERNIYQSYTEQLNTNLTEYKKDKILNILLKICCCGELLTDDLKINIQNCKTFEEIQQVILNNNENQLESINKKIKDLKYQLELFEADKEQDVDDDIKLVISSMKKDLTSKNKERETLERSFNYLKTVINAFKNNENWNCSICLTDNEDIERIGITCCGHKFCWECLVLSIKDKNFCPQCKHNLKINDYFEIKNEQMEITNQTDNNDLNDIINKTKSTKIGHIIMKIKSFGENDKCIVFSQWDDLLTKVGDVLLQNNIEIVYCKGTIYQRNNSIKKFKTNSNVKVIMLSSDHCASGLNLMEANKIIFIEPVYGTNEKRRDIENQAIGRVNRIGQDKSIEIIRFIMKDTVEENLIENV